MFAEGIFPIGDGLLDIDEERLKALLVPDDINEIYDVEQTPFARGKFAAVRRAIHKNSGVHFAAKFLKRRRRAQSSDKEIKHEIAVLMLCNEANNIVKLNAVHESRSDTALLLELATGGELQTFLDNEECLNEAQARICMREVLKALQFLHKRSIVHLDLKPQNILLAGERIEDGLKLCDFGISRFVTEGTNVREIVGTPDYVAPEVLQYEPLSLSTDIWSVGVLAYVLLSGFSPFGGETKQETFLNISQCALTFPDKLFGGVSSAAIDFIRKALRIKPNDRMTAAGCLEHIWLKDECNIDRHIFTNILSNKQQLEHNNENDDVDDDDDDDDDENIDDVASNADDDADEEVVDNNVNDSANGIQNGDTQQIHTESLSVINNDDEEVSNNDDNNDDDSKINVKDLPEPISVDHSEESEDDFLITANTTTITTSSTTSVYNNKPSVSPKPSAINKISATNGHLNYHLTNGYTNGICKKSDEKYSKSINGSMKQMHSHKIPHNNITSMKTTTVVHNVPATKAITIPLSSKQQQHQHQHQHFMSTSPPTNATTTSPPEQSQFLHIPARRQSSESNKENTFLATKNISAPPLGMIGIKKPSPTVTQSATATIVINPSVNHNATYHNANNIVATITLPSCTPPNASLNVTTSIQTPPPPPLSSSSSSASTSTSLLTTAVNSSSSTNSLFPDAPTTPKVIRKAPNSDTSPTSVKALVKKFQLEGGEQPLSPPEFATNGSKPPACGLSMAQMSTPLTASSNTNGTSTSSTKTNETKTKYINGRTSLQNPINNHHSVMTTTTNTTSTMAINMGSNGMRRASEPITAIHHSAKKAINGIIQSSSAPAPVSIPTSSNNLKTSCVYCKNLSASSNGCRHPTTLSSSTVQNHHTATRNGAMANSASCSTNFSQSTKSLINGSSSNGSLTSSSSSSNGITTTSNASSSALLFGNGSHLNSHMHHTHGGHLNGHQHQHHHHHHHLHHHGVVVKTATAAANGLSLDQGIIC